DILRRANDAPYDIEAVTEEKCFGPGFAGETRVRLFDDAGVAVSCGEYLRLLAVDRARRRRGIGSALLRDAAPRVIAAEPGNYFTPGVPEAMAGFFTDRGFRETAKTWNLHAELQAGDAVRTPFRTDLSDELLAFVRREFGKIWSFEVSRARSVFWIENVGFAAVEANNRGLGTFGPTGVAKGMRGRGHGRELLRAALAGLSGFGYERAVIQWTGAVEFYRRSCGAEPAHRFATLTAC
ncbi:MAG TPA: GNAT family N-acetyltransferase, partial [Thermoanaerobaculia bacterium]|nr:GNAT family N-acetyltransferase [Thermoanaerobaculia bacterium]